MFICTQSNDGSYVAHAHRHSIYTQADSKAELKEMIQDAVRCHFDNTYTDVVQLEYNTLDCFCQVLDK